MDGRLRTAVVVAGVVATFALTPLVGSQSPDACTSVNWDLALTAEQRVAVDGLPVDYAVSVGNSGVGACDVTDARVDLALPDGSTLTLADDADFAAGGEVVTYMARYLADEEAHAVGGAIPAGVTATGTVQTATPEPVTVDAALELPFAHPAVEIDAGADRAVAAGSDAQLEVTVRNTGDVDLEEVVVDDGTFDQCDVAIGDLVVGEAQTVSCTVAGVEADATRAVTVRASAVGNLAAVVTATDEAALTVLAAGGSGSGAVGDRAWFDIDGDGVQDLGEPGAPGVEVVLLTAAGEEVARTTTGNGGLYLFKDVAPGDYLLAFTLTDELVPVTPGQGGPEIDSDLGPDGRTGVFTVVAGADDRSHDAGFVASAVEILPATGLDAGVLAVAALLLMLAGAGTVLLVPGRRRA